MLLNLIEKIKEYDRVLISAYLFTLVCIEIVPFWFTVLNAVAAIILFVIQNRKAEIKRRILFEENMHAGEELRKRFDNALLRKRNLGDNSEEHF